MRGLLLSFVLSFVNLAGLFLSITLLGGLGQWTTWEFVGLAGLTEAGLGLAFIVGPNIWRLPVAEAQTSDRTSIRLALDVLLIPRWGALARVAAGVVMLAVAAAFEGVSAGSAAVGIVAVAIAVTALALSLPGRATRRGTARLGCRLAGRATPVPTRDRTPRTEPQRPADADHHRDRSDTGGEAAPAIHPVSAVARAIS